MKVILAKSAGFCFGVNRAVQMVEQLLAEGEQVCTLGPIIHNEQLVADLEQRGVRKLFGPSEAKPGDRVVIRSHGVGPQVVAELEAMGAKVVDATCPFVAKIHKIVQQQSGAGKTILLTGDAGHPEIQGIVSWASGPVFVIKDENELQDLVKSNKIPAAHPVAMASQTTFHIKTFKKCAEIAKKHWTNLQLFDTICGATGERQGEAAGLAQQCDVMLVVGGRHSSNTKKLFSLCAGNTTTHHIETAAEIQSAWFGNCACVGVTAGASTPSVIIKEVIQTMREIENKAVETEEFNFEEALENSFKTVYTGEKVTGLIVGITPTYIQVDIGTKHMGIIPLDELTDDPTAQAADVVKVGEEVELIATRVNDIEGIVTLSKKRLDAIRGVELINEAAQSGEVLEGVVTEIIKGGVIVTSSGVKVFVPASQATMSRNEPLEPLKNKKVSFKIIEASRPRKRAVGSIRLVTVEARKAAEDKVWADIEVGKVYQGTVKSLMPYGVFVDIGGVDGMVHISELSWGRIKHPSEVVAVGDQIEVYIKDLNAETHKISLGYKKAEDNPWEIIRQSISVGTVVSAKVVSLPPFGAFVQLIPGVDGLIHISQLSNERVEKPSDLLEIGQEVTAKVTEFDADKKRISLSIRALIEQKEEPAVEEEPQVYSTDDPASLENVPTEE